MFGIKDDTVFEEFEEEELRNPCPRKEVEGRWIYTSRELRRPKRYGPPVLCDFGSTVSGEKERLGDVQPDIYRSPEVILQAPWQYKIDIWNAGCLIWDIFEGGHLFYGTDPEHKYRSRAHLAEIMALLGPPPPKLLAGGTITGKFFAEDGTFQVGIDPPPSVSLEELETNLEGAEKERFMMLMRKMLQWLPQNRSTAKELADDPWINGILGG
ncbi:Protein kinase [Scedosporium apiospermum]|uniref:Protein kinase n=1 Tax=Pseudallescheria apiosperma TaxID=563466 RepID=A0A084FYZ5_PSEDA|nr:Protein kinase [Scedosporium apiospermum]KEZ40307.1 Protein kinase [Scedosporium apiospermum]